MRSENPGSPEEDLSGIMISYCILQCLKLRDGHEVQPCIEVLGKCFGSLPNVQRGGLYEGFGPDGDKRREDDAICIIIS